MEEDSVPIIVRVGTSEDACHVGTIQRIMDDLARSYDLAVREGSWLMEKLGHGTAVLAIEASTNTAVGFGCYGVWREDDKTWISHSAILVDPHSQARGIGKKISEELIRASMEQYPDATIMLLTTNPKIMSIYEKAGAKFTPLMQLIKNGEFWSGCRGCRSFARVNTCESDASETPAGFSCCCKGMTIEPNHGTVA